MNVFESIGLTVDPFSTAPSVELFYNATRHKQCLEGLELAIRMKRGLSVVRGGIGVGKTTLSRKLIENFKSETNTFEFHLMLDPKFESELELLKHIIKLFGIAKSGNSVQENRNIIENHLLKVGVEEEKTLTLIVDEGQNLPENMLDVFRTLLNFEANDYKLLQLIIFGQPEMGTMIKKYPNFEDRISFDFELGPLSLQDTIGFINYRMKQAGGGDKDWFTQEVIENIYKKTAGYPRRITNTCHVLLLNLLNTDNITIDINIFNQVFSNNLSTESNDDPEKKEYSSIAVNKLLDVLRNKEDDIETEDSDNNEDVDTDDWIGGTTNEIIEKNIEAKPTTEAVKSNQEKIIAEHGAEPLKSEDELLISKTMNKSSKQIDKYSLEQEKHKELTNQHQTKKVVEIQPSHEPNTEIIEENLAQSDTEITTENKDNIKDHLSDESSNSSNDNKDDNSPEISQIVDAGAYPSGVKPDGILIDKTMHGLSIDYGKIRSVIIQETKKEKLLVTAHKLNGNNADINPKSSLDEFNEIINQYFHDLSLKLNDDQSINKSILEKIKTKSSISLSVSGFPMTTRTINIPKKGNAKIDEIVDWALRNNLPFQADELAFSKTEMQSNDSIIAGAADKTEVEATGDLFRGLGFSVQQFAPEQIAIFNAFKWNYQEYSRRSTIIFHLGERHSFLLVCKGNCLLKSEPIHVGMQDLLQTTSDFSSIKKSWDDRSGYQIPAALLTTIGINKPNGLFDNEHRQIIEKWQQSFNRALAGIRKTHPLDENTVLILSGSFCEINYSDSYFGISFDFDCHFFNPFRNLKLLSNQDIKLIGSMYPLYTVPVGLALSNKNKVNLLPKFYFNSERFRLLNKLLVPLVASLLVILIGISGITYAGYSSVNTQIPILQSENKSLEHFQKKYREITGKKSLINNQLNKMSYDQEYTSTAITLMKYISSITPNEIELDKIAFHYGYEVTDSKRSQGRIFRSTESVNTDKRYASFSGKVLTNSQLMQQYFDFFKEKLNSSNLFYSIDIVDASVKSNLGLFTFLVRCEF